MTRLNRLVWLSQRTLVYVVLSVSAIAMLFPFLVMLFTSFKVVQDTFRYPPTLLPHAAGVRDP